MYWLRKCIFYVNPKYNTGVCKTCKKVIGFHKLKSADPRNGITSWQGPQELKNNNCLEKNTSSSFTEKLPKKL